MARLSTVLRTALSGLLIIGRAIGWDKPEALRARAAVSRLRELATELPIGIAVLWFAGLDLDFGVSDPAAVAAGIEQALTSASDFDIHLTSSLWRLAARGYHLAKWDADKYRCQTAPWKRWSPKLSGYSPEKIPSKHRQCWPHT